MPRVQATKKMDIYKLPDLLIIHLKRFNYIKGYHTTMRDKINSLVNFPLEGLDMSKWLINLDTRKDLATEEHAHITRDMCMYDCFGVSNHMGGMGGGHYTAYSRALTSRNWYSLNDSITNKCHDTSGIISSSAYVLYYQRRGSRDRAEISVPEKPSKPKIV